MGARTEREKRVDTLHLKDGRRLSKHPAFVFIDNWLTTRIDNRRYRFLDKGDFLSRSDNQTICRPVFNVIAATMDVEENNALMRQIAGEVDRLIHGLEATFRRIDESKKELLPELMGFSREMTEARTDNERELSETLSIVKAVSEFLTENDYAGPMAEIGEFVSLCKRAEALKQSGTLDAVSELASKLRGE